MHPLRRCEDAGPHARGLGQLARGTDCDAEEGCRRQLVWVVPAPHAREAQPHSARVELAARRARLPALVPAGLRPCRTGRSSSTFASPRASRLVSARPPQPSTRRGRGRHEHGLRTRTHTGSAPRPRGRWCSTGRAAPRTAPCGRPPSSASGRRGRSTTPVCTGRISSAALGGAACRSAPTRKTSGKPPGARRRGWPHHLLRRPGGGVAGTPRGEAAETLRHLESTVSTFSEEAMPPYLSGAAAADNHMLCGVLTKLDLTHVKSISEPQ